jgi:uncharacterized membrane protein
MVVQQFFYVRITLAAASTNAQAFEQFATRTHALVDCTLNLGIRYRLANAYIHGMFPQYLSVMLIITILINNASIEGTFFIHRHEMSLTQLRL